jgi:hypothetical protein
MPDPWPSLSALISVQVRSIVVALGGGRREEGGGRREEGGGRRGKKVDRHPTLKVIW